MAYGPMVVYGPFLCAVTSMYTDDDLKRAYEIKHTNQMYAIKNK